MIKRIFCSIFLASLLVNNSLAQQPDEINIIFPETQDWNHINEGETLEFQLRAEGGALDEYRFRIADPKGLGIEFSMDGAFSWTPDYGLVTTGLPSDTVALTFEVLSRNGERGSAQVDFVIFQKYRFNTAAQPEDFVVRPKEENVYQLNFNEEYFFVEVGELAQGITFEEPDKFRWKPTETQWLKLDGRPLVIDYALVDKEYGDRISRAIKVVQAPDVQEETPEKTMSSASSKLNLLLPEERGWNIVKEGEVMSFQLRASGGEDDQYSFNMLQGNSEDLGISFDTLGNFYWKPTFDQVGRLEEEQLVELIFEVNNRSQQTDRQQVELLVYHTNRAPQVGDLHTFYIQHNAENVYQLSQSEGISDPDDDPLVFKPILSQMPQGMSLSGKGELTWKPSYSQYSRLQRQPLNLEFVVEDQPYKAQTKGHLRITVTQQDHPPQISMVPANQDKFEIREDEALNLKFYLSDPNGDQDIMAFDFVTETSMIPESALIENDKTQWEFIWTPGYDFFVEAGSEETYQLTFFVIDRTNQRTERTISVTVQDAENLVEKDRLLYSQYREGLVRVMNLMDHLKQRQKELQKEYKKAKKGKKHRAITTASLGAITGLSPVVLSENQQTQRYVSGIGGTTSMTIGSLEASNVIGKDPSDIFEKLSYINRKINDLETQGEVFAGKYALSNNRRENSFTEDLKKLIVLLNLKDVTTLELDANWRNPRKASDKNIQETFKSFNPDPEKSSYIND